MEKKNTILLTVIAIATLLVAVVGATFAYFTATVTTDTADGNNTTTVTTQALASAVMEMGSKVTATGVYPGFKAVKSVTVKGSCPSDDATCKNVDATITVTPAIATEFGSDVTWKLYKSTTEITCTGENKIANGTNGEVQHSADYTCNVPADLEPVASGSTEAGSANVSVGKNTNDTYYLVVEYANNEEADQNAQQGKSFSVALDFVPTAK